MSKYDDPQQEYKRGYNFGKEDGFHEAFHLLFAEFDMEVAEGVQDKTIIVKIPYEKYLLARQTLRDEAKATA